MTLGGGESDGSTDGLPLPLRLATVLLGIGLFAVVVAAVVSIQSRTPSTSPSGSAGPRASGPGLAVSHDLSRPIRRAVVLVPLDDFPAERATAIRDRLSADYGLPITVAPSLAVRDETFDSASGQLVAESVVHHLGAFHPEWQGGVLVIGLTTTDLRIDGRPDWRFAFSYRVSDGLAVVSSANLSVFIDLGEDARWNRFGKMVLRNVAFLYYGLRPTSDPADILYDNILRAGDVDHIPDHL